MNEIKIKISPNGTIIAKALAIDLMFGNCLFGIIAAALWIAGLIGIGAIIADLFELLEINNLLLAAANFIAAIFLFYYAIRLFYFSKIKHPKPISPEIAMQKVQNGELVNLYSIFSFELAKVWNNYVKKSKDIPSAKNLISCIVDSKDFDFVIARIGYSKQSLNEYLAMEAEEVAVDQAVLRALKIAVAESHHQIETGDLFIALCERYIPLKKFLSDTRLEIKDLANIVYWQTTLIRHQKKYDKKAFDPDDLHLSGGIGRDWAYGFTPLLRQYGRDITDSISRNGLNLEIVGHDKEIEQIQEALTRDRGGNVLLVGEAGIGKKTTVMGLAKSIQEGSAMGNLKNQHMMQIDIDAIIAGASAGGDITQRISAVFNEAASAGNIVIFIENIQNLFSSGDAGKVNAVEVLLPYLEVPGLYVIGTCDIASYNRHIAINSSLMERFTKISLDEPSNDEMVRIIEDVVPTIEHHTGCLITYGVIKETIKAADKYIMNIPNPEKSINLLDGAAAKAAATRGRTIVVADDINEYVAEKYDVPATEVGDAEKTKLLNLENIMHQRVIGQKQAIDAISNALRRTRAGITNSKKPIGSFLFLGSTGVGKTETAKALAEAYFGNQERMIRFDMSEYQNKQDIYRLIGASIDDEEIPGQLTSAVREHPFSLLLFDELEKANPDILNLFLQILDEGHLTDGNGRRVSFTNTIIIATSNAGAPVIKQSIGSGVEYESLKKTLMDYLIESGSYRPEFLNRFTQVVVFSPLNRSEIEQIAQLMLKELAETLYKNKEVILQISPDAVSYLASIGFDPTMGARPMARTIQDKVEDMLAKKLLSGELNKDDSILITAADLQ